jgi:hypothetical protein
MKVGYLFSAMLCAGVMSSGAVVADDDTGWFIGAGISRLDADFEDVSDVSFSDSDNTGSLKAGYMFNNNVGVELGYLDLGDYTGDGGLTVDANAGTLALILNWPVAEKVDLYGKIGAFFVKAKSNQVIPFVGPVQEDDDTSDLYGALGGEIDLGQLNFFAEFSAVDTEVSKLNIDILTLGIKWEFGR